MRWLLFILAAALVLGQAVLLSLVLSLWAKPAKASELLDLARTIHGESSGESRDGMLAVGFTVINRIATDPKRYGATVSEVVRRRGQYTVWSTAARARRLMALNDDTPGFISAKAAAALVLRRAVKDPSGGATHFHSVRIHPAWARGPGLRLGGHIFYRGVR
jgi:N-acetylmuramoyl-L-alanine amidase